MTKPDISIVLLVHNNQQYLPRLLDYYKDFQGIVVIADSSAAGSKNLPLPAPFIYKHLPGIGLIEKVATVLANVDTTFVSLCGVDDYTIPGSMESCINFLLANPAYSSAIGNSFYYKKDSVRKEAIEYFTIYPRDEYAIADGDPVQRLQLFFDPYKTIYTAVHYTRNLLLPFAAAAGKIRNLFLNEYMSGIYPMTVGGHAELPFIYQLRENTPVSDGVVEVNLHVVMKAPETKAEYEHFIQMHGEWLAGQAALSVEEAKRALVDILEGYSNVLEAYYQRSGRKTSFRKIIADSISMIPVFGKQFMKRRVKQKSDQVLRRLLRSAADRAALQKIEENIFKYKDDIE